MKGWTEFLKELASPSIFDDMREPGGKEQQERQKLLAQIYDITKKEEEYETGDIGSWNVHYIVILALTDQRTDGEGVYYWPADDANDKSAARKKNRRRSDLVVDDSGTDSYADSVPPPSKRLKKKPSATTPVGSPAAPLRRMTNLDDTMQDCKPHSNAGFLSDLPFVRPATASPQGPWDNFTSVGDSKNPRFILPVQGHARSVQDLSCMPQAYTRSSPWIDGPSPAPIFQWPYQNFEAQSQVCPVYMASSLPQPQFEDVSLTGLYTPPILSHTPPASLQNNPYLNGVYYCQTSGAQPFVSPIPSTQLNNTPSASHNVNPSWRPCNSGSPEQCYSIDPCIYRHQPETNDPSDQYSHVCHGGPESQAPARIERGFTGHGSGVGGGAHT